jgi:16S rRNA (cytosine967-C5)-methyltransferase
VLDRVPAYAAVDQTVSLARRFGAGAAGYVNAVLRAVAGHGGFPEPDAGADPRRYWTTVGSHPAWLVERWLARLGAVEAGGLMAANNMAPPLTVVANPLRLSPDAARDTLRRTGMTPVAGRLWPQALRVQGTGGPAELPGFSDGLWIPMDEGGILPVAALDLRPGQRVLDATAGGGGKTALIAAAVAPDGEVLALDTSARAIRRLGGAMERLGLPGVSARVGDARRAGGVGRFPRVLLDAPCTGLGTLRRRPEIKWRRRAEDLPAAQALQRELLDGTAAAVAPGGLVVYSTCSLEPEETDEVIGWFLDRHPEFSLDDPGAGGGPLAALADGGVVRAWPHRHETDGFFVARLRRSGS